MSSYGVSINKDKSIVSTNSHQVEFAKRQFYNGVEITGLKNDILMQASKSIKALCELVRVMSLRGYFEAPGHFSLKHISDDKSREYATVLLACTGLLAPPYEGVTLGQSQLEELRKQVFELRLNRLKEQRDLIMEYLFGNKPIK